MVEVVRKNRRWQGKSDPVDAEAAARAALAERVTGVPKQRDGQVEALRALRCGSPAAPRSPRTEARTQIRSLLVTAPKQLRAQLTPMKLRELLTHCATRRRDPAHADRSETATLIALRSLARRSRELTTEINDLEALIAPLVAAINPILAAMHGVGPDVAGQFLVTAGENPHRLRSEAAFAMLCGAAPLPASSGRTHRHRLNRGGDRQANAAIYRIVLCRLRWAPRTRAYADRRAAEGMSKKEIIRCLKRYIDRDIFRALLTTHELEPAA